MSNKRNEYLHTDNILHNIFSNDGNINLKYYPHRNECEYSQDVLTKLRKYLNNGIDFLFLNVE